MTESHTVRTYGDQELNMLRDAVMRRWMMPRHSSGDSFTVDRDAVREQLEEDSAAWDIIRGWFGAAAVEAFDELSDLRTEYQRVQRVMDDTASWLKDSGHRVWAALLRRQIHSE